jgi:hypothetical protein
VTRLHDHTKLRAHLAKICTERTRIASAVRVSSEKGAEAERPEPYLAALLDQGQSLVRSAIHNESYGNDITNVNI